MPDLLFRSIQQAIPSIILMWSMPGCCRKFAFNYADAAHETLSEPGNTMGLLSRLPSDSDLLSAFVSYAWREAKSAHSMVLYKHFARSHC